MKTPSSISLRDASDAELVAASIAGDRGAFAEIVARHQSLICSVAYSSSGGLHLSEDIAQETFLTAWKRLSTLREPQKLRSWLCRIARLQAANARRRRGREARHTEGGSDDAPAGEPAPSEQAITREQEAILWAALERIPELYREPLVLFYREHQSIERVATELELTTDAVKQRLARGRKLLHEEVAAFVEGTLARSGPGPMFGAGVLAALPVLSVSGSAAGASVAAAMKSGIQGLGAVKVVAAAGAVVGPIAGLCGAWAGYRAGLAATRTPRERDFMTRWTIALFTLSTASALVVAGLIAMALTSAGTVRPGPIVLVVLAAVGDFVLLGGLLLRFRRRFARLREQERVSQPEAFQQEKGSDPACFCRRHRSRRSLLGVPLFDARCGTRNGESVSPAFGWFACGDVAVGLIGAIGGVAIAPVSLGAVAVGVCGVGGLALGGLAVGAVALGGFAVGGVALGWIAMGGVALAWKAGLGGAVVAHDIAIGGRSFAIHANDATARAWLDARPWLDVRRPAVLGMLNLLWIPSVAIAWILLGRGWRARRAR